MSVHYESEGPVAVVTIDRDRDSRRAFSKLTEAGRVRSAPTSEDGRP